MLCYAILYYKVPWSIIYTTPNLPTNMVDFRGFYSSTILKLRGEIPRPIGDLPESLSQAMLVGVMLVGGLGVGLRRGRRLAGIYTYIYIYLYDIQYTYTLYVCMITNMIYIYIYIHLPLRRGCRLADAVELLKRLVREIRGLIVYIYIYIHTYNLYIYIYIYVYIHVYMYMCMCVYLCIYISLSISLYTYICIYTNTYIYI